MLDKKISDLNLDFIDENRTDMPNYMLGVMKTEVQLSGKSKDVFVFGKEQCPNGTTVANSGDLPTLAMGEPYCVVLADIPTSNLVTRYIDGGVFTDSEKLEVWKKNYIKSKEGSDKLIAVYNEIKQFLIKDAKRRLVTSLKKLNSEKMATMKKDQGSDLKTAKKGRILLGESLREVRRLKRDSPINKKLKTNSKRELQSSISSLLSGAKKAGIPSSSLPGATDEDSSSPLLRMQGAKNAIVGTASDVKMIADSFQNNIDFIKDFRTKYPGFVSCDIVRKDIMLATNSLCVNFMNSMYDFTMEILLLSGVWILLSVSLYANGFYPAVGNWKIKSANERNLDLSESDVELSRADESSLHIKL